MEQPRERNLTRRADADRKHNVPVDDPIEVHFAMRGCGDVRDTDFHREAVDQFLGNVYSVRSKRKRSLSIPIFGASVFKKIVNFTLN